MEMLTVPLLRQAIESRDGQTLAGFYADDATLRIIDQENPPSRPHEIKGRAAIAAYYDDVCGRTMTHRLDSGIRDGDRVAFTQTCTYPDGNRVFCSSNLELSGGKIVRQVSIQAWGIPEAKHRPRGSVLVEEQKWRPSMWCGSG